MPKPKLRYTLIGFQPHTEKPVIFNMTWNLPALHAILNEALDRGVRTIMIRTIHPLPEPKGDS